MGCRSLAVIQRVDHAGECVTGTTVKLRDYAVTACAKSSSSSSSSTGEKVLSGLVESVIGLRLP